ncbi:MAG: helix-turn-helix transcriptional regulator [Adlercreutzia sp.]|nr:helix-turn-helix transcriptional regulator [Adlercreutzia sp.]
MKERTMSFRNNLQYLRASHSMTQEQLAMLLGVSRQSVTKWEAEKSYPEMDKLLKMCQIFDVSLDDLVQGNVTATPVTAAAQAKAQALRASAGGPPQDVCGYDEHMRAFAAKIATGVLVVLVGVALLMAVEGWAETYQPTLEALGLIPLFVAIAAGVALFLVAGLQHTEFQRNHPFIQDFYTSDDRQRAQRFFAATLVAGIVFVFTGIVAMACTDAASEFVQMEAAALMMGCFAVGAFLIVYGSMLLGRLNIANYNQAREQALAEGELWEGLASMDLATLRGTYTDEQLCAMLGLEQATDEELLRVRARLERRRRKGQITGGLCAIIMIVATIAGLVMLFVPEYQTPYFWLAWAIGGLLCAVSAIAVSSFVKDDPTV